MAKFKVLKSWQMRQRGSKGKVETREEENRKCKKVRGWYEESKKVTRNEGNNPMTVSRSKKEMKRKGKRKARNK